MPELLNLQDVRYLPSRVAPTRMLRHSLLERLEAGLKKPLTLLTAPSGYGKTTFLAQWSAETPLKHAWLTLDRFDNDPARFMQHLVSALQRINPAIGKQVFAMLQAEPKPQMEAVLASIVRDAGMIISDFVLIIDDYHHIYTRPVHAMMSWLLTALPPQMHVVLVGQVDPPFEELGRFRSNDSLEEIRAPYFSMTVEEAEALLKEHLRVQLPYGQISAIVEKATSRTIAVYQMALHLQDNPGPVTAVDEYSTEGNDHLEYPLQQLFAAQEPDVQGLLCDIAVVEPVSAELAATLTQNENAGAIMRQLAEADHFLEALAGANDCYRMHPLVREFLHVQMRFRSADYLDALHHRAALWFVSAGIAEWAFFHAIQAQVFDMAAEVLIDNAQQMLEKGEMQTVMRWLEEMPEEQFSHYPRLAIVAAWVAIIRGDLQAVDGYLIVAGQGAQADIDGDIAAIRHFLETRKT